jgi:hypothetical protein
MTATTDKLTCPECGAEYETAQGLGAHRWRAHDVKSPERLRREALGLRLKHQAAQERERAKQPPVEQPPAVSQLAVEVRKRLEDVSAPLRTQLAQLDERLDEIGKEAKQLQELRREITSVLGKLDPQPKQPKQQSPTSNDARAAAVSSANALRAERQLLEKSDEVEDYLLVHADELREGFTSNQLTDVLAKNDVVTRGISVKSMRTILERLRDKGVVRHDQVVRGGGMRFKLITTNGDQP